MLAPFDIDKYLRMPELIGVYRVNGHDRFMKHDKDGINIGSPKKINATGIKKILDHCKNHQPKTQAQIFKDWLGTLPMGTTEADYDYEVHEYNPKNLPYIDVTKITKDKSGHPQYNAPVFHGTPITIDGKNYSVDANSLEESDFEDRTDMDMDEFFAE